MTYAMIDIFWYFLSTLITSCVIVALFVFYRLIIGDKYLASADKLKSMIANMRRDFPELKSNPGQIVDSGIEKLGVDGIIDSLGLPAVFKPIAKGLIDSYLNNPEKLQGLLDKLGVKIPSGKQESSEARVL